MKSMIEKAREASPPATLEDLRMILYECEAAKNRYMNRSGYSPVQRQIGQWPRLPGSLMSDETIDPALQAQGTSDAFDKLLEIRQVAQEAFMKLASREAAAKSLKARRHVLALEGSVVWINMFGELWRASIEQTREATTLEKLGVEVVAEDFSEMQERLRRSLMMMMPSPSMVLMRFEKKERAEVGQGLGLQRR